MTSPRGPPPTASTLQSIPGAIVIGSDGGSEGIVLDMRPEHASGRYPIYAINFVCIDWEDALMIAPDFRSFLLLRHGLLGRFPRQLGSCVGRDASRSSFGMASRDPDVDDARQSSL